MFTGPVGPVEVFFYWPETVFGNFYWPGAIGSPWPETVFGNFYWPGAIGSPLASSPESIKIRKPIEMCNTCIWHDVIMDTTIIFNRHSNNGQIKLHILD